MSFPRTSLFPEASDLRLTVRHVIAGGLAFLTLLAPGLSTVSAKTHLQIQQFRSDSKQSSSVDGFIIEMIDGVSTCRDALPHEISLTLPREGDVGVPVRELLKPVSPDETVRSGDDSSSTGLTINLVALSQLQSDSDRATVIAAFERAAAVWTSQIKSPVTITINIDYGVKRSDGEEFPDEVLGSTGSGSISQHFPQIKEKLLFSSSSSEESSIYNALPSAAIPTDTGDGSIIAISRSLTQPLGLLAPEPNTVVATISFNKNFAFDFNPDNGIDFDKTDFVAVATHEIGHALGFTSNSGEGTTAKVTLWDMFRFRPGTTSATFPTAQRIMSLGGDQVYFTGQTFTVQENQTTELGLSTGGASPEPGDGDERQSSHWKDDDLTGFYVGIMDPNIPPGVIKQTTENDFRALETIGWNLVDSSFPTSAPLPPINDNFNNAQVLAGCSGSVTGNNLNASAEAGEPFHVSGGGRRSVWYHWQAPSTGTVTVNTVGSGYDTILAVYTGNSVGGLSLLGSNDDFAPDLSSRVQFSASAGTVYRIAVDGFDNGGSGGDMGPITLNWNHSSCSQSSIVQMGHLSYSAAEANGSVQVSFTRSDASAAGSVDYATSDPAGLTECSTVNGVASSRCDYATSIGTIRFAAGERFKSVFIPLVNDSYAEGTENFTISISNPVGAALGPISSVNIAIQDNESSNGANPIDTSAFFVEQHYIDFLGRNPEPAGKQAWMNILSGCPSSGIDSNGNHCDQIEVSAGFFRSPEFQTRGYFIYRFYSVVGSIPLYPEFLPDFAKVSGFLSDAQLEANKAAFVNEFMARPVFQNKYASTFANPTSYVDALLQTVGLPSHPFRTTWINQLSASNTTQTRGDVLRALVESQQVYDKYYNEAFVIMQYFGYLRRTADGSYVAWINTMNQTNGDYRIMINGFMNSAEYRKRFGP